MDTNKKHIDDNSIAQYIDWLRGQGERPNEKVIEHVADCYECKEMILELSEILDKDDKDDKAGEVRQLKRAKTRLIIRAAAVFVGVIIVALAIDFLKPEKDPLQIVHDDADSLISIQRDSVINKIDSIAPEIKTKNPIIVVQHDTIKYARNFEPNPGMEVLLNAHFRSESTKKDILEKVHPDIYHIDDQFKFDFTEYSQNQLLLTIVNSSGEEILQLTSENDPECIFLQWEPGLYYWKLSTSDELVRVGKFRLYNKDH